MNWVEIRIHTSSEAEEAVCFMLQELGTEGVSVADSSVRERDFETPYGEIISLSKDDYPSMGVWIYGYLPELRYTKKIEAQIRKQVADLKGYGLDPGPALVTIRTVAEESWEHAWKAYYKPVRVSHRLTVKPQWEVYEPISEEELVIEIDPGMAFGTGTHPTTRLCMNLMEKWLRQGDQVIDVGCGSGILSIAAAKLGADKVLALDLDPVAVENAASNVALNHMEEQVTLRQGDLLKEVPNRYDLVLSNILAEIIVQFTDDLPGVLKSEGILIASGIIADKEEMVKRSLSEVGFTVADRLQEEDWIALVAKRT